MGPGKHIAHATVAAHKGHTKNARRNWKVATFLFLTFVTIEASAITESPHEEEELTWRDSGSASFGSIAHLFDNIVEAEA